MKDCPLISVIIPCCNSEALIASAIRSALDQTHSNKEVIVIDDGSTDGSLDVIQSFGDTIRWETGPNRGGSAARNRGVALAKGNWIQFLDADDCLKPDKMRRQESVIRSHPEASLVVAAYRKHHPDGRVETIRPNAADPWIGLATTSLGHTSANLWRREAVLTVGGWDEHLRSSQEYNLMFKMLRGGASVVVDQSVLTEVRVTEGSISNTDLAGNLERYINLRGDICRELAARGSLTPERREIINEVIFNKIRLLAARDIKRARIKYDEMLPVGYLPKVSVVNHPLYCAIFQLCGFVTAECSMRVFRQLNALRSRLPRVHYTFSSSG